MFGDCQVMSSLGGAMVPSDPIFSSPLGNPNFNFLSNMPFHHFPPLLPKEETGLVSRGKEAIDQCASESELQLDEKSGNEQDSNEKQRGKKKRYHRHTTHQIQEMEAMFKECQHPDDKQRLKLSQELGLKPRQVKFWFQNRRTQLKAQQDRTDNIILRAENETLKNDNYRLQAELRSLVCTNCGGSSLLGGVHFDDLRLENNRLREELERICCLTSRYTGRPIQPMALTNPLVPPSLDLDMNIYSRQFPEPLGPGSEVLPLGILAPEASTFHEQGPVIMEEEKSLAMELAVSSMNELVKLCHPSCSLWTRSGNDGGKEELNVEEYLRLFSWPLTVKQHPTESRTEASRCTSLVIMNSINLVDAFLDANRWTELFPSVVARAKTLQVISHGVSGPSGALHLMYGEFHLLSPLVPTREAYFLRFCHQNPEEGSWVIVDFPVDSFHVNAQSSFPLYRRRPSGCLIQDMPNGYSRVTWLEHAEIEEKYCHHIFSQYVHSGAAFGAHRWLTVLQRQCERVASLMARNISDLGVIPTPEARKNLMRLAQRMVRTFCVSMSTSNGQSWTALSDSAEDTVRIMTRKNTEPGQPTGVILCAVSSTWLPYSHRQVFDLIRDEHRRSQLDVLSNGNSLHEVAHIANGSHPGNCISLLRINVASNSSHLVELMIQETCTDQSGSMVVYTTVDVESVQLAMNGEDPSCIPLMPIGFVIVPMESPPTSSNGSGSVVSDGNSVTCSGEDVVKVCNSSNSAGCLLTVGLQVLASTMTSAKLNLSSVTAINNHLCNTVSEITSALSTSASLVGCPEGAIDTAPAPCSK